jgi:hypothetical protein
MRHSGIRFRRVMVGHRPGKPFLDCAPIARRLANPCRQQQDTLTHLLARAINHTRSSAVSASGNGGAGGGESHARGRLVVWEYLDKCSHILITFSKSDKAVKEGMAREKCLSGEPKYLTTVAAPR